MESNREWVLQCRLTGCVTLAVLSELSELQLWIRSNLQGCNEDWMIVNEMIHAQFLEFCLYLAKCPINSTEEHWLAFEETSRDLRLQRNSLWGFRGDSRSLGTGTEGLISCPLVESCYETTSWKHGVLALLIFPGPKCTSEACTGASREILQAKTEQGSAPTLHKWPVTPRDFIMPWALKDPKPRSNFEDPENDWSCISLHPRGGKLSWFLENEDMWYFLYLTVYTIKILSLPQNFT